MKTNSIKILSTVALGVLIQAAQAGNITDINVSVLPNKQRVIKLKFDSGTVEPTGFITSSPARVALDFAGTDVKLKQPSLTFTDSLLNKIVAAQGEGHARVLLDLAKDGQYSTQVKGNEVWVYLSEAESTNSAPAVAVNSTKVSKPNTSSMVASVPFTVDFHKGENNSGLIEYASNYSGKPEIKVQTDRLVITLKDYPLATQDQRNLDVTDFSTPVKKVSARRLGNDTQIVILTQGAWDYKISGGHGRQTIQILADNLNKKVVSAHKKKFTGRKLSLDFKDVSVRDVLNILGNEGNINIIANDNVQGQMTLTVRDIPWDEALDLVLNMQDLDMRKTGNVINIAPRGEFLERDKAQLTAQKELDELGTLISRSFQLKYKNVEEFRTILKIGDSGSDSSNHSILSSRGSALVDPSTNTLIINDVKSVIDKFEKLIAELDEPARQVMVEARIVEASDGFARNLGVRFGFSHAGSTGWGSDWANAMNNRNVAKGSAETQLLNPNVNIPTTSTATGSLAVVRAISSGALGLELSAAETDKRTKTISTPRVLTQDRKEAVIEQGMQIPYVARDGDGKLTTSFKDAVMSLKATPRITPDNQIILDVEITKDEPDWTHTSIQGEPGLMKKRVKTQAMIEDGGTLIVGGVYQEEVSNTVSKVPLLGDIPVVGNLFKSRLRKNERNELLFFITPRIMGSETNVLRY